MADADIDDVLNALGFGRMQLIIFFSCAILQLYITNEQFGLGLVTVAAGCDYDIDSHRMAWLMTAVFIAQVFSSPYMGYKSDSIGRRKLMIITSVLSMVTSFISALMPNFWSFLVMRFIVGCVLTGPGMAVLTYMSEFTRISLRPAVINFMCYSIGLSMIYVPACAIGLMHFDVHWRIWNDYFFTSWRMLIIINLLPGLISILMLCFMPESPKYYLSINNTKQAMEVLEKCCRYNKGKDVTLKSLGFENITQPRRRSTLPTAHRGIFARMWFETKPLFKRPHLVNMLLALGILFVLFATGFGLTVWMPRVFKMTKEIDEEVILCSLVNTATAMNITSSDFQCGLATNNLLDAIYTGSCCLATFMLVSLLLICVNRKIILLAFTLVAALSGFMLNFFILDCLIIISFIFLTVPPLCSLRLVLSVIIDIIPTHLRSKAVALSMCFGRVGLLAANMFIGYTLHWNCLVTFNVFVLGMLIAFVLIYRLPSDAEAQ